MELVHAFAGNPIIPGKRSAAEAWRLLEESDSNSTTINVVPMCQGKPLVAASPSGNWRIAWQTIETCENAIQGSNHHSLVYLGEKEGAAFFAIDAFPSTSQDRIPGNQLHILSQKFSEGLDPDEKLAFVDLRSIMAGTDEQGMNQLSIAGHARALLEWHNQVKYCGRCGTLTEACDAGQRRRCTSSTCKNKAYPRIDPVVIMLVIDKDGDRALLSHISRYSPRMWSCLAGFIEPGESLEEAVRRETKEETGVEVGEVVYHSSQPWPVGPSNMPSQLMVGFFAFAKTFELQVDKNELEDARWYSRQDVEAALVNGDYVQTQKDAGLKIYQVCTGVEMDKRTASSVEAKRDGILVPGPYAIAHHLISTWALKGSHVLSKI